MGNDIIVRGLNVTKKINKTKTGVEFTISPGALIQDLTYIEIPTEMKLSIDGLPALPDQRIIIYSNWRYMSTVYKNDLKVELTLYNPIEETTLNGWNTYTNRVILGIYQYDIENGKVTDVYIDNQLSSIVLLESNVAQNSKFDGDDVAPWIELNSKLSIEENGYGGTSSLRVKPAGAEYQGFAQNLSVKTNVEYRCSFLIRGERTAIPFTAKVVDGKNIYSQTGIELGSISRTVSTEWMKYEFVFTAISNNATFILTKNSKDISGNDFFVDHVYVVQYAEMRKGTDINSVKYIDGGVL